MIRRENKNNAYAKFGGTNKEYYGILRTGLLFEYHPTSGTEKAIIKLAKSTWRMIYLGIKGKKPARILLLDDYY